MATLNAALVRKISRMKQEPDWMLQSRLSALKLYHELPLPPWGPDLSELDANKMESFIRVVEKPENDWDLLPKDVSQAFDGLNLQKMEQTYLAGLDAQLESEAVYQNLKDEWASQGVIFIDTDSALREYPELFRRYFGKLVDPKLNKFAALNYALWSGGSFLYVPENVKVTQPVQAYFRMNTRRSGQFERTLIIAESGSEVNYIEGCSALAYSDISLHAAVVETFAGARSHVRYTTIQHWSNNVYNLVTKRAEAGEQAEVNWVDCNIGSKVTMKYPGVILKGRGSSTEMISLSVATQDQVQDTGANVQLLAPDTKAVVTAKSLSLHNGVSTFRAWAKTSPDADRARLHLGCDNLLTNQDAVSNSYPQIDVQTSSARVTHEASIRTIESDELLYLQSKGIPEDEAVNLLVGGFVDSIIQTLPPEYAIEMYQIIRSLT